MYKLTVSFWVFIAGICFLNKAKGQGCLVSSNIYSNPAPVAVGVNLFSDLKLYTISGQSTSCFTGSVFSSTACFVCDQGGEVSMVVSVGSLLYSVTCNKKTNAGGLGPYYSAIQGVYYSSYAFQCDFDDYSWALGAITGGLGFLFIRRGKSRYQLSKKKATKRKLLKC